MMVPRHVSCSLRCGWSFDPNGIVHNCPDDLGSSHRQFDRWLLRSPAVLFLEFHFQSCEKALSDWSLCIRQIGDTRDYPAARNELT